MSLSSKKQKKYKIKEDKKESNETLGVLDHGVLNYKLAT